MAGTSGTLSRRIPQVYEHSQSFPRLEGTCQRERPENGKAEALLVFSISGGAFSDLRKGHPVVFRRSENRPSGPLVVALFRIKGKENYRWLRFERFPTERRLEEAPQVR